MDRDAAKRVLAEVARRAENKTRIDWSTVMFEKQAAFVNDPSKRVAAVCSRRAGKSTGVAFSIVRHALRFPDSVIPYITLIKRQGKEILWPELRRLNAAYNLGLKFNQNDLSVTFPNKSRVYIIGGREEGELETLRGLKYPAVYIDEAQAFRGFLAEVIEDIIEPSLLDLDGSLYLTGTPNAACAGYFHDVTNTKRFTGWSVHSWTARDNPHLPNFETWLKARKEHYRWSDNDPTMLREWEGKWVRDGSALVYNIQDYNLIDTMPEVDDIEFVLGLDLGYVDSTAFTILGFSEAQHAVYLIESYKQSKLIPSAVAAHVERLRERYPFRKIVADTGGLGKGYVEEMKQRFRIPIEAAKKQNKNANIELLNGDLKSGVVRIVRGSNEDYVSEANLLQWNDDRTKPDDRFEDHLCDSFLYGYRECRQYLHEPEEAPPKPGTPEWCRAAEDRIERDLLRKLSNESGSWWEQGWGSEDELDIW